MGRRRRRIDGALIPRPDIDGALTPPARHRWRVDTLWRNGDILPIDDPLWRFTFPTPRRWLARSSSPSLLPPPPRRSRRPARPPPHPPPPPSPPPTPPLFV